MNSDLIFGVIVIAATGLMFLFMSTRSQKRERSTASEERKYQELRNLALQRPSADAPPPSSVTEPWGVVILGSRRRHGNRHSILFRRCRRLFKPRRRLHWRDYAQVHSRGSQENG